MEAIKEAGLISIANRESFFEELYKQAFPGVAKFVRKMGGDLEDAKDIFHDALVVFYEKISNPAFVITTSEQAYLLGISKHLWLKKFRNSYHKVALDELEKGISIPEDYFPDVNNKGLLQMLENAGKKCMELLRVFYYQKLNIKQVAQLFGYSSEHSAAVQKYKCLEKVRDTIKQKSMSYEDFIE